MARPDITINVKAFTTQAQKALKQLGTVVAGLAAGAMAALFAQLVRMTPELVKLAASSDRARDSLNALTDSRAEEFVEAIQTASLGTVSALDAMTIANRSLFMGVVDTSDQMAQLVEVSIALGRVQGLDATTAINDASLAIARQSKLIADNLGIIIDMERVNAANNKQQEFLNQFLEEGNKLLAKQGGLVKDDAAEIEALAANVEDAKERFAAWVKEAIIPTVRWLNETHDAVERLNTALEEDKAAAFEAGDSFEEYAQKLFEAGVINQQVNEYIQEGRQGVEQLDAFVRSLKETWQTYTFAVLDAGEGTFEATEQMRRLGNIAPVVKAALDDMAKSARTLGDEISKPQVADLGGLFDGLDNQLAGEARAAAQALQGGFEQVGSTTEGGLSEERIKAAFIAEIIRIGADDGAVLRVKKAFGMLTSEEEAVLSELNRLATLAATGDLSDAELSSLGGALGAGNFGALGGIAAGRSSRGVSPTTAGPSAASPGLPGGGVGGAIGGGMADPLINVTIPAGSYDRIVNKDALEEIILDTTAQAGRFWELGRILRRLAV